MKYFSFALALLLPLSFARAETPVYSNVAQSDVHAVDAGEGLGEPDGITSQIIQENSYITYGFPEVTTARLHKAHVYESPAPDITDRPWVKVELINLATVVSTSWQRIDGTLSDNLIGPSNPDPYDRVRFTLLSGDPLLIDAVWHLGGDAETTSTPEETAIPDPTPQEAQETTAPTETTTEDTSSEDSGSEALTEYAPRLIKLFNDGDPQTQHDTTVYLVDSEGKRRPFSNEVIYFSWFTGFSTVEEISPAEMASIIVGAPMPMHYGTWLIKIQSTNDVYAVSSTNVLHRIPDEITAIDLYGEDWTTRVRDVFPTDWPHYEIGEEVFATYPDDTLIRDANLVTWILRDGMRYQVPEQDLGYHGIQPEHRVYRPFTDFSSIPIGDMFTRDDDVGWFNI